MSDFKGWFNSWGAPAAEKGMTRVAVVRAFEAAVIQEVLAQADIESTWQDHHNPATWEPMTAISVADAEADHAVQVILEFRNS